jgi:hypothetical protein
MMKERREGGSEGESEEGKRRRNRVARGGEGRMVV